MKTFLMLLKRNVKLFFKDKGMFFTSLITPLILLLLYATFLANVYRDTYENVFSQMGITISDKLLNGAVGGQLLSSLLAVSCVTVSFCSNMLMVQDKVNGARKDLLMAPVKRYNLALSYYTASAISTLAVCYIALGASLIYIAAIGWFMSFADILLLIADVFILVMFGTALSSVINYFLSSQGQISAVGTIVSSCYGFVCGAYMPLSSFSEGLRNVLMFLPGTYGTSLMRNHSLDGVFREMTSQAFPEQAINGLKNAVDCNLYFFKTQVSVGTMYLVTCITVAVLISAYILINVLDIRRKG